jgi:UDP-N-acetylglucosamine 4,6-dehydratase
VLPITDPRMTRFWIELEQAVRFVHRAVAAMRGSEIFVPKLPSVRIVDVARAIGPACRHDVIGCRLGEKLHEVLIGEEETARSVEYDDLYVVYPFSAERAELGPLGRGRRVDDGFVYASDRNPHWLGVDELRHTLGTGGPTALGAAGG